jgi:hypothetical protein
MPELSKGFAVLSDAREEYKSRLLPEELKLIRVEKRRPMEYKYGVFAVSVPHVICSSLYIIN